MMLVETYTKTDGGVDKVCIMIPPDLVPGSYKFEAAVNKANESGVYMISLPSLRTLTIDETFEQIGVEPPPWGAFFLGLILVVFTVIGLFKAGK